MATPEIHCMFCERRRDSVFCGLPTGTLERIDQQKVVHVYERGQALFYSDTPALAIHCLHSGSVKLTKATPDGQQQVIRVLMPGSIVGYRAVLAGEPYAATAEAIERSIVCIIPKEELMAVLRESEVLNQAFLRKLAEELRVSEEMMLSQVHLSVKQRVGQLLVYLLGDAEKKPSTPLTLKANLQHQDMAELIGTTPQTFSRTLKKLEAERVIRREGNQILIEDLTRLHRVAKRQVI